MQPVDHDTFLQKLTELFVSKKDKGSIWLTHKRLLHDGEDPTMKSGDPTDDLNEYPCLVRVTDGSGTKFETQVNASELIKFHIAYGSLLKSSMTTLRKRDKKREKHHAEEAAKRKAKMTEAVKVDGNKRGGGRRKRQRQIKALVKQQDSQKKFKQRDEARRKGELTV